MRVKFKVKEEKREQEKQAQQYPEPARIEKLFNAWKNGGQEGLRKALKESSSERYNGLLQFAKIVHTPSSSRYSSRSR